MADAKHTPAQHAAAHMAECRHQRHHTAIQSRKVWRGLVGVGFGWHPDAHAAREQMRESIRAARFYHRGQEHYTTIAEATGSAR